MRTPRPVPAALPAGVAALAIAACGSSSGGGNSTSTSSSGGAARPSGLATIRPDQGQARGGTLNVVSNEAWEHLDPGQAYFQIDYLVVMATQRPLYAFKPEGGPPEPDIASGPPQISADGKTVTVKIKPNIK